MSCKIYRAFQFTNKIEEQADTNLCSSEKSSCCQYYNSTRLADEIIKNSI